MPELERVLAQLRDEVDWPATPDLAPGVMERLDAEPAPRRRAVGPGPLGLAGLRRSLVLAVLGVLLAAGTVFAAVPGVRDAVLDFFGLQGATVERRETLPTPPPERPLDLGTRMTLADASERVDFTPLVPRALGAPDGVYVRRDVPGGMLSLTYRPARGLPRARTTRVGALVSELRGDLAPEYVGKLAGAATEIDQLDVDGSRALWLEGAPHFLLYRDPTGMIVEGTLRLAQNVLLLERGSLLIRIEGAFDRSRAVEIARSLR